jgi:O-antigen ligase
MAFFQESVEENLFGKYLPDWMIGGGEAIINIMRPIYRNGQYRVNGISITSLEFAELFVYLAPFLLYFIIDSKNVLLKFITASLMVLAFIGILKTGSRLGNVGLLFGTMTYIMIWSLRQWLRDGMNIIGPAIVTLYISGIAGFVAVLAVSTRIRGIIFGDSSTASSSNARLSQLTDGLPIIASNPVFGYGIGMGADKLNYRNPAGALTIDSYWLSIAIETGLTGLICFLLFFISLIWSAAKLYIYEDQINPSAKLGAALASALSCFLLIKLILSQTFNNSLIYFMAAITLIILNNTIKLKNQTQRKIT